MILVPRSVQSTLFSLEELFPDNVMTVGVNGDSTYSMWWYTLYLCQDGVTTSDHAQQVKKGLANWLA
jgi:hypothetical protein